MTRRRAIEWASWSAATIVVTAALLAARNQLHQVHFALAYLLLVLAGSASGGLRIGLALTAASFALFDWFFVPPYQTLGVSNPADWLVLLAFLVVSVVAAELMHRLQREASVARERAVEIDRLATLGVQNAVLASVSHDLRTPLTTIKALAHEIAPTDMRAMAIEEEADRLNRMVTDLLDLSRVQGGAANTVIAVNAVDDLVGSALQRATGVLGARRVNASLEDGGTLLVARFDFVASLRILVNLLENAHKYSPPDAPIDLHAVRNGKIIEIRVSDRGPGVAPAERERIFEPFYRPASATPDAGSAGLGLAIALGLARAQDSALTHRERDGGGSTFTLSVPAVDLPDG